LRRGTGELMAVDETTDPTQDVQMRLLLAETELLLARRQLDEAQRLARVGSWEWDIENNRVWWSDELYRIYGMEVRSTDPTYEDFLARVHPDDRDAVDARNQRAFVDHQPFEDVKRVVRSDGREILMRTQGDVVCDELGAPLRMIGICEDVTDRMRAEEAEHGLAAAEAMRQRALEINDEIIQRVVLAQGYVQRQDTAQALAALDEMRHRAQKIVDELFTTAPRPGDLRRSSPA